MWWILIPAGAVAVSALVALRGRRRVTTARFETSADDRDDGPAGLPPA